MFPFLFPLFLVLFNIMQLQELSHLDTTVYVSISTSLFQLLHVATLNSHLQPLCTTYDLPF